MNYPTDTTELISVLWGCMYALREAGKDFALSSPLAARPNLYEMHAQAAQAALAAIGETDGSLADR